MIDKQQMLTERQFAKVIILDRLELFRRNYQLFKALVPEVMHRPNLAKQATDYIAPEIQKTLRMLIASYVKGERTLGDDALEMLIFTTLISHGTIGLINREHLFKESLEDEINAYIDAVINRSEVDKK